MSEALGKLFIDPKSLPEDAYGFIQVIFLGSVYGVVLFNSSNLISDGSELLLLVPSFAGLVGSVVLPVLGAVPDGAIVLFSGMGADAQKQMSVGVGALAGSTIMLLTIPWALSIIAGRVNIDRHGNANYKRPKNAPHGWAKLMPENNRSLKRTGVVVGPEIVLNGRTMMLTSLIYLVIQVPAFQSTGTKAKDAQVNILDVADEERTYALIGFVLCVFAFLGYLIWNVQRSSKIGEDALDEKRIQAIRNGDISLSGLMCEEFKRIHSRNGSSYGAVPDVSKEDYERLEHILRPFFKKYDANNDHRMDMLEMRLFFKDLNEEVTPDEIERWFREADSDKSGFIEFRELVEATVRFLRQKNHHPTSPFGKAIHIAQMTSFGDENDEGDSGDEDEEEDVPDDLAGLSVEDQQRKIKLRSLWMMSVGTIVVLLFADPMVSILSEIGERTGIPSFYISFVVAPLASNASELIAAYKYAKKKTSKTISISVATLLGAACMNNTFCLGIFMGLMAFKGGIAWEFSAETISILLVEFLMFLLAQRKTQTLGDAVMVLAVFPLSILLVFTLENVCGLD